MTHSGIKRPIPVVTLAIMSMKTVPWMRVTILIVCGTNHGQSHIIVNVKVSAFPLCNNILYLMF